MNTFAVNSTISTLFKRHGAGLISDASFEKMITGLQDTAPEHSNPLARSAIAKATAELQEGAITDLDARVIIVDNYEKLSGYRQGKGCLRTSKKLSQQS